MADEQKKKKNKGQMIILYYAYFLLSLFSLPVALFQTYVFGGIICSPYMIVCLFLPPHMHPEVETFLIIIMVAGGLGRIAWSRCMEEKSWPWAILGPLLCASAEGSSSGEI